MAKEKRVRTFRDYRRDAARYYTKNFSTERKMEFLGTCAARLLAITDSLVAEGCTAATPPPEVHRWLTLEIIPQVGRALGQEEEEEGEETTTSDE